MWTVMAVFDGKPPQYIEFAQVEGEHRLLADLLPMARERWGDHSGIPWHVMEAVSKRQPAPWADPIPLWAGSDGVDDRHIRVSLDREGSVILSLSEYGRSVWQHPTVVLTVIPDGAVEIILQYGWDLPESQPTFVDLEGETSGELLPTLDGRLYGGSESVILEINEPPSDTWMRRAKSTSRRWIHSWRLNVRGLSGMFVGRILRRGVERPRPVHHDPGFIARLNSELARNPLGASCKEISNFKAADVDPAVPLIVAVHGSFSCAVELASRLKEASPSATVSRFEHDTFRPLSENIISLVSVLERLHSKGLRRVLLVSHSRGGLVASQAVLRLKLSCAELDTTVWTAGTPHRGTPVAGFGGDAALIARGAHLGLNAYYRTCARREGNSLGVTTAEGAASYLYSFDSLPPGISAMAPDSSFIDIHRFQVESISPRTWGGICDPVSSGSFGQGLMASAGQAFFEGVPNDLIVASASSILDGSTPLARCNHFQYFEEISLSAELDDYLNG